MADSAIAAALFDPCTIPDDAIAAAGLDPSTENPNIGPEFKLTDWKVCDWEGPVARPWYSIAVLSTASYGIGDIRARNDWQGFQDIEINGRTGVESRVRRADPSTSCIYSFEVQRGLVSFYLDTLITESAESETCQVLVGVVDDLEQYLPGRK